MAAAFDVGVGELIDEHDLRPARNDGVEVHLFERLSFVIDMPARDDFQTLQQRLGVLAAVSFDDAGDDVIPVFFTGMGLVQHFVGLAHARRGADENPELADAPLFAARRREKGFGRGSIFGSAPLIRHH